MVLPRYDWGTETGLHFRPTGNGLSASIMRRQVRVSCCFPPGLENRVSWTFRERTLSGQNGPPTISGFSTAATRRAMGRALGCTTWRPTKLHLLLRKIRAERGFRPTESGSLRLIRTGYCFLRLAAVIPEPLLN